MQELNQQSQSNQAALKIEIVSQTQKTLEFHLCFQKDAKSWSDSTVSLSLSLLIDKKAVHFVILQAKRNMSNLGKAADINIQICRLALQRCAVVFADLYNLLWTVHLNMLTTAHAPYSYKDHCQNSNFANAAGCFDLAIMKKNLASFSLLCKKISCLEAQTLGMAMCNLGMH